MQIAHSHSYRIDEIAQKSKPRAYCPVRRLEELTGPFALGPGSTTLSSKYRLIRLTTDALHSAVEALFTTTPF